MSQLSCRQKQSLSEATASFIAHVALKTAIAAGAKPIITEEKLTYSLQKAIRGSSGAREIGAHFMGIIAKARKDDATWMNDFYEAAESFRVVHRVLEKYSLDALSIVNPVCDTIEECQSSTEGKLQAQMT